jgi:hypothetical protein
VSKKKVGHRDLNEAEERRFVHPEDRVTRGR